MVSNDSNFIYASSRDVSDSYLHFCRIGNGESNTLTQESENTDMPSKKPTYLQDKIQANRISIICIVVTLIVVPLIWYYNSGKQNTSVQDEQQPSVADLMFQLQQNEIGEDAIESYLYAATLQAFQLAQAAGVDSKEYRDYEQRYADYRTFRDSRVRKLLERYGR